MSKGVIPLWIWILHCIIYLYQLGFLVICINHPVLGFATIFRIYSNHHRSGAMKGGAKKKTREEEVPTYEIERVNNVSIRRVQPMIQAFETFAKGRWVGREIGEVVTKEFGGYSPKYWENAFKFGHIRINGQPVTSTYRFKNSDRFLHQTHRHEPPVVGDIDFVAESSKYFAVCKPSSIPVHPSGAFRYNSLEYVLKYCPLTSTQPSQLHLVHRLDKVTSGLVIFAKSSEAAAMISKEIREKSTTKRYLARVKGRFPELLLQNLHPLSPEHIYNFMTLSNTDGDLDEDDENDATNESSAVVGKGKSKRVHSEVSSSISSSAATITADTAEQTNPSLTWQEKKRQRQESYKGPQPSSSSSSLAGTAAISADTVVRQGKGADVSLLKVAPSLNEVRAHIAVGYYPASSIPTRQEDAHIDADEAADRDAWYVQCPLEVVSRRDGVHACFPPPAGKPSVTMMRLLTYDSASDTSLIECQPVTGRTHQIRLHCQLVGHPIANDPCYGGELFYRDTRKQAECQAAQQLMLECGMVPLSRVLHVSSTAVTSEVGENVAVVHGNEQTSEVLTKAPEETDAAFLVRSCRYCAALRTHPLLRNIEVSLHCDGIWLHAWQYSKKRPQTNKQSVVTAPLQQNEPEGVSSAAGAEGERVVPEESEDYWSFEAPWPSWATDAFTLE